MSNTVTVTSQSIQAALETAEFNTQANKRVNTTTALSADNSHMQILAQCLKVTIKDRKVCLSICTTGPIPTGVEITISVGDVVIIRQSFGRC